MTSDRRISDFPTSTSNLPTDYFPYIDLTQSTLANQNRRISYANLIPQATTTVPGIVQLTGDLGGTYTSPSVPGLLLKANINSPNFTGIPTTTTPDGTVSSQVVNVSYLTSYSTPLLTDFISVFIDDTPEAKQYKLLLSSPFAYSIISATLYNASGSSTLTINKNGTALSSTLSISTTKTTTTFSTPLAYAIGDDLSITIGSVSLATDTSITLTFTRSQA